MECGRVLYNLFNDWSINYISNYHDWDMVRMKLTPWDEIFDIKLFSYAHCQTSLIREIDRYTPKCGSILEVGFGTGWTTYFLSQLGYNILGIDFDYKNWRRARAILLRLPPKNLPVLEHRNLFDLNWYKSGCVFHTGFSDGLFEHFDDDHVVLGLQIMKEICRTVIMDVPTWKYRNAEIQRGDEIYRKNREWRKLIKQAGFKVRKMYGSVFHCPRWLRFLIPELIGRSFAPYFTTKVGFVI